MKFKMMNTDEKRDWIETFIGGACGVIAIIAAIIEYKLGDNGAIAGMLKDVFGTAVVVVLLILAMPKHKPRNLAEILEEKVERWGMDNAPMIFKAEGFICAKEQKYKQGFVLLQNPSKYLTLLELDRTNPEWHTYASYTSKQTGKFIDLPSYEDMVSDGFEIMIVLEQKHFKEKEDIKDIIENIKKAVEKRFGSDKIEIGRIGNADKFTVKFNSAISNRKDIDFFISVVDFILSLVKVIA